jgi:hypothetical protein
VGKMQSHCTMVRVKRKLGKTEVAAPSAKARLESPPPSSQQ